MFENLTIIIRSVDERTTAICKKLISDQGISDRKIFIVNEIPFSKAMKTSFQIGISEGVKWTYCVDADVLLKPGSIAEMLQYAEKQSASTCEIQGFVMDKFFGGPRQAGNHLYRTSLLPKVIKNIPEEGTNIRPERYTLGKMAEQGYPWKHVPCIVGLHDDYQYHFDIYRKAFVHGIKHLDRAELLLNIWKQNAEKDDDFKIALRAFSDSIIYRGEAFINSNQAIYRENFEKAGIAEKKPLIINEIELSDISNAIANWQYHELFHVYFPDKDGLESMQKAAFLKLKRNARKQGYFRTGKLILSELLLTAGKALRR